MTTLGVNSSTQDRTYTWADTKPTHHPINRMRILSIALWKLSAEIDDLVPHADILEIQRIAKELDDYANNYDETYDRAEQMAEETQLRHGG